jgi:hypothetical protein
MWSVKRDSTSDHGASGETSSTFKLELPPAAIRALERDPETKLVPYFPEGPPWTVQAFQFQNTLNSHGLHYPHRHRSHASYAFF